jgi:Type I restriction modification DNA specificity domain
MLARKLEPASIPEPHVESFPITLPLVRKTTELRLDASFYNPRVAEALAILRRSELEIQPLHRVTQRIFIPPRFKRIYVDPEHGVPFLQGSHVVHFQPTDMKYLSRAAHVRLDRWIIRSGWVLVTCSGTIGRATIAPNSRDGWAASQHICRIVPDPGSPCPPGYIYAYLLSELGQAQLTAQIYGAVVDELTEDQAQSVLIPVPVTREQTMLVQEVDTLAMKSIEAKDEAVRAALAAVAEISALVPELAQPETWAPASPEEDKRDAEIARRRIAELQDHPEKVIQGSVLEERLAEFEK